MIIGSTAIKHYFPNFPREPKDLDVVVSTTKGLKNDRVNNTEFLENPIILQYQQEGYLEPNYLLTLKMSHLFWDINWEKHMFDTQFLLKKGCKYNEELLYKLISYWEKTHPKIRRSNLEMNKESFFNNAVNKDTDEHDYLHTLINPVPMYTRILKDGAEVELDEKKWENLSFNDKLEVVREEAIVMAWERYNGRLNYRTAFKKQLKDNIIKHYPKFIAIFAIENYIELEKPKYNYMELLTTKIKENELQIN